LKSRTCTNKIPSPRRDFGFPKRLPNAGKHSKFYAQDTTDMLKLNPDFKEFIQLLNENEVKYLLIGGYAVSLYGYQRYTSDIDFWILADGENIEKVVQVLFKFGFSNAEQFRTVLAKKMHVFGMGLPPFKIEIVNTIDGVVFEDCYKNKEIAQIDGLSVPYLSLADLRKNKLASGRFKDLNDLEHLPVP
jgi:hypothetical protein